jgi:hypothetical protein
MRAILLALAGGGQEATTFMQELVEGQIVSAPLAESAHTIGAQASSTGTDTTSWLD